MPHATTSTSTCPNAGRGSGTSSRTRSTPSRSTAALTRPPPCMPRAHPSDLSLRRRPPSSPTGRRSHERRLRRGAVLGEVLGEELLLPLALGEHEEDQGR